MDKLVLIDGNSLLNRAFYATPLMTTTNGQPTNAIFGFCKLLFKVLDDIKPQYLIIAFDLKAPTFRHKRYDGYKATRKPMPEELAAQIAPLKSLLAAMNIATCAVEGLEADDIIGTLSNKFPVHSYIYTGDRDSYQLVNENTDVHFTIKGVKDLTKLNIHNFEEIVGLKPAQIVDLKALMGDKSDNIPGVAGIGEKTAKTLLAAYATLDGIYENIDCIKGATKEKLLNDKDMAYLSYELATIKRDCDLDIEIENAKAPKIYSQEVRRIFAEFEFKSFLSLDIYDKENTEIKNDKIVYPECKELFCKQEINAVIESVQQLGVYFSAKDLNLYDGKFEYVIHIVDNLFDVGISVSDCYEILMQLVQNASKKLYLFESKSFMHLFDEYHIQFLAEFEDLSVIKYLCNDYNKTLTETCLINGLDELHPAFAVQYLCEHYLTQLKADHLDHLYYDIEKPLIGVMYDMEIEGIKVDLAERDKQAVVLAENISKLEQEIYDICGEKFNINSPSKLGTILFEKLGLKAGKKGKNGNYSTNADILEKLAEEHDIAKKVLEYRGNQKLFTTYIEGIRPLVDKNNIIHTTFNQTVTTTGRLSSTNPNLQNIPIRVNEGKELRKMFVPKEGNVFIDADYSQIELRLLAHFSGCRELILAYKKGLDIHAITASQVFGVPVEEVTELMRRSAKAVNFGIIYGMSEFGLANNLKIPTKTAKEYIEKYFATYSDIKDYINENVEFAKVNGYVRTITGRKRVIPEIRSSNYNLRQFGERASMNMPLQGSGADIIKMAMNNVFFALKKKGLKAKLIVQVHDELLLDTPKDEVEEVMAIVKEEMENVIQLKVPLTVDVHIGDNWYDAK